MVVRSHDFSNNVVQVGKLEVRNYYVTTVLGDLAKGLDRYFFELLFYNFEVKDTNCIVCQTLNVSNHFDG